MVPGVHNYLRIRDLLFENFILVAAADPYDFGFEADTGLHAVVTCKMLHITDLFPAYRAGPPLFSTVSDLGSKTSWSRHGQPPFILF